MLRVNDSRRPIDVMEIGDLVPFKFMVRPFERPEIVSLTLFQDRQGARTVSLDVRAEARKQVIRITNYNPEISLYKPTRRNTISIAQQDSASSSQEAFEAVREDILPAFTFSLDLEGVGLSLVNRKAVEVVYLSINSLKFDYSNSSVGAGVNLVCGSLQVDNQLHDAVFPVVVQPTPIPKDSTSVASLPTIQGSLYWLKDQGMCP